MQRLRAMLILLACLLSTRGTQAQGSRTMGLEELIGMLNTVDASNRRLGNDGSEQKVYRTLIAANEELRKYKCIETCVNPAHLGLRPEGGTRCTVSEGSRDSLL